MNIISSYFKYRGQCACVAAFIAVLVMGVNPPAQADADDNCVMQVSQPLIDYGQIDRTQLFLGGVPVKEAVLGKRTLSLTAVCETTSAMALSFRGEAADDLGYRFARDGIFLLKIVSAQLDGKPVGMVSTHPQGGGSSVSAHAFRPGVSLSPSDASRSLMGKRLNVVIEVETHMNAKAASVKTQEVLSGSGQFELLTR